MSNKRVLLIVLSVLAVLALCACGSCAGLLSLADSTGDEISESQVRDMDAVSSVWGPAIPGLAKPNITTNLEQRYGLVFGEGSEDSSGMTYTFGDTTDAATGASLDCSVYWTMMNGDYYIPLVEFQASAPNDPAEMDAIASAYLGYCATVPYNGADPAAAEAWVRENVPATSEQGNVLETVIGGARFTLYGTDLARILEITHEDTPK